MSERRPSRKELEATILYLAERDRQLSPHCRAFAARGVLSDAALAAYPVIAYLRREPDDLEYLRRFAQEKGNLA